MKKAFIPYLLFLTIVAGTLASCQNDLNEPTEIDNILGPMTTPVVEKEEFRLTITNNHPNLFNYYNVSRNNVVLTNQAIIYQDDLLIVEYALNQGLDLISTIITNGATSQSDDQNEQHKEQIFVTGDTKIEFMTYSSSEYVLSFSDELSVKNGLELLNSPTIVSKNAELNATWTLPKPVFLINQKSFITNEQKYQFMITDNSHLQVSDYLSFTHDPEIEVKSVEDPYAADFRILPFTILQITNNDHHLVFVNNQFLSSDLIISFVLTINTHFAVFDELEMVNHALNHQVKHASMIIYERGTSTGTDAGILNVGSTTILNYQTGSLNEIYRLSVSKSNATGFLSDLFDNAATIAMRSHYDEVNKTYAKQRYANKDAIANDPPFLTPSGELTKQSISKMTQDEYLEKYQKSPYTFFPYLVTQETLNEVSHFATIDAFNQFITFSLVFDAKKASVLNIADVKEIGGLSSVSFESLEISFTLDFNLNLLLYQTNADYTAVASGLGILGGEQHTKIISNTYFGYYYKMTKMPWDGK